MLINLISNSLKFTNKGSITVTFSLDDEKNGEEMNISVEDTGIGMSEKVRTSIFRKYATFNSNDLNKEGVGLGLTIS